MEQRQDSSSSDFNAEFPMPTTNSSSSSDSVSSKSTSTPPSTDSASSSLESSSLLSGSQSSVSKSSPSTSTSTVSQNNKSVRKPPACYYDPTTCKRQNFSLPDKIVYYLAKNATNAETFQKLVGTCKYFFKVNPVIVVPHLYSDFDGPYGTDTCAWFISKWSKYFEKPCFDFKNPQTINFKIWLSKAFATHCLSASELIPTIYKNDATYIRLGNNYQSITWKEFLFFAGSAETLYLSNHTIKYENGQAITLERIVENLPKIKYLEYFSNGDGSDITPDTLNKLMEIKHLKDISHLGLLDVPEELNVDTMFSYVLENKHIKFFIRYRFGISDECKERIGEYSKRLKNEKGCRSHIIYKYTDNPHFLEPINLSQLDEDDNPYS